LTFLFDENISPAIVRALKELGKPVAYLTDILPRGTDDAMIFQKLGELGWFLVTQDQNIKRKKHEREALKQASIGAFIFTGRGVRDIDSMTILILKHFQQIEAYANSTRRPFIFGISDKGSIDRLD
jgi:predicted nuclease of predicted toxin-antitoxin system